MEKLLVTSNFSFSHSVFKRLVLQTRKNQGLFGKGLMFVLISRMSLEMDGFGSKTRSLGQVLEKHMLVTKGLGFKSLLCNAIPHNSEGAGERL